MTYIYFLLPEAEVDYNDSILWYLGRSISAAENFMLQVENILELLCENPFLGKRTYQNIYELKVKKFPFNVVYFIEEENHQIVVVSIFHDKRDPERKFNR